MMLEGRTQTAMENDAPASAGRIAGAKLASRAFHAAAIAAIVHVVASTSLIVCIPMNVYVAQRPRAKPAPAAIHQESKRWSAKSARRITPAMAATGLT